MNIAKFHRIKEDAAQDISTAQNLGDRMLSAREAMQLAESALKRAQVARRESGSEMPTRYAKDVESATAEFKRVYAAYLQSLDQARMSGQLVNNLQTFLIKQGITP